MKFIDVMKVEFSGLGITTRVKSGAQMRIGLRVDILVWFGWNESPLANYSLFQVGF